MFSQLFRPLPRQVVIDRDDRIASDLPCASCGYNLRGLLHAGACPECNAPVEQGVTAARHPCPLHAGWEIAFFLSLCFALIGGVICFYQPRFSHQWALPFNCLITLPQSLPQGVTDTHHLSLGEPSIVGAGLILFAVIRWLRWWQARIAHEKNGIVQ